MNQVTLVGRLTRDPELRSLPSGKTVSTFSITTAEFHRPGSIGERTEYHACVAWDRLAEIVGQFLSKGQLVSILGRLQTRQWDDDAGKRHWKTEVVVTTLEMLSGRSAKEYAKEAQTLPSAADAIEERLDVPVNKLLATVDDVIHHINITINSRLTDLGKNFVELNHAANELRSTRDEVKAELRT